VLLRACLWIVAATFIGSFVGGFLEGFVQGFIAALAHKGGPNAATNVDLGGVLASVVFLTAAIYQARISGDGSLKNGLCAYPIRRK
jgi:hypothetical protein